MNNDLKDWITIKPIWLCSFVNLCSSLFFHKLAHHYFYLMMAIFEFKFIYLFGSPSKKRKPWGYPEKGVDNTMSCPVALSVVCVSSSWASNVICRALLVLKKHFGPTQITNPNAELLSNEKAHMRQLQSPPPLPIHFFTVFFFFFFLRKIIYNYEEWYNNRNVFSWSILQLLRWKVTLHHPLEKHECYNNNPFSCLLGFSVLGLHNILTIEKCDTTTHGPRYYIDLLLKILKKGLKVWQVYS